MIHSCSVSLLLYTLNDIHKILISWLLRSSFEDSEVTSLVDSVLHLVSPIVAHIDSDYIQGQFMGMSTWTNLQVASISLLMDALSFVVRTGVSVDSVIIVITKCHCGTLQLLELKHLAFTSVNISLSLSKVGLAYFGVIMLSDNSFKYFPATVSPHYKLILAINQFYNLISSIGLHPSVSSQVWVSTTLYMLVMQSWYF